ncbi:hypothetical protein AAG570_003334 [Ranatra chinensis]|uniref:Hermansky-Pudlak syndrome 1 n=1 Tax=Ranatra chinensis TaxID=642074 RepID=A0ABD0Y6K5_9HEMI
MRCLLVFDHLNDLLYSKCDSKFVRHVRKLGRVQGFTQEEDGDDENELNVNFVIQLFSPIVTSQRIMSSQFGNSYTSIQCQDGTNMVFDEYMGYLFVNMGFEEIDWLKRMLGVFIALVQHLCGPDVSMLKAHRTRSMMVSRLLDTWSSLVSSDQAVLVEAVEQLTVNTELSTAAISVLRDATDTIKSALDFQRSHALIFVENKFLALYSSRSARELTCGDLLFLSLMTESVRKLQTPLVEQPHHATTNRPDPTGDSSMSSDEYYSPESSPEQRRKNRDVDSVRGALHSELVLLSGGAQWTAVMPHVVHISTITEGVSLLLLYQTCNEVLSTGITEAFAAASCVANCVSGETETARRGMERLESAMKRVFEGIKKTRPISSAVAAALGSNKEVLHTKWDLLKRQWKEHLDDGQMASVTACCGGLTSGLRELYQLTVLDDSSVASALPHALSIAQTVAATLAHFTDFLKVKALRNFTLGSYPFFYYIYLCLSIIVGPPNIWSMVEFSRSHLQDGHLAVMWKDTTFNYAYFLWFEDGSGTPLKPKLSPSIAVKSLPIPGVISGDFYLKLIELCFPKSSSGKVRCYELYCIHLGLATSSCVLEHSRRLSATIWEVTGVPNNPLDLL